MLRIGEIIIDQSRFPDNSLLMKVPQDELADQKQIIYWNYEDDSELFALICLKKYFGSIPLVLYMPYCPHARQDRVKNPEDVFTLKYFCEVINDLNFTNVVIEDPHSNVCVALLDRVVVIEAAPYINKVIGHINDEDLVMCYPDEGAMKRYSGMVSKPYAFGVKKRNWEDGSIVGLDLVNADAVKGKNVLIVDDICSRGGTFYHTAKALKEAGAEKVYLYVTHCETTIFLGEVFSSGLIDHVYTTNSIFPSNAVNKDITIIA
jgi:ribose-phosphate pyrophosphokinase